MNYTEKKYKRAKSDMLRDFNKAITDAADLLKTETAALERAKEEAESAPTGTIETGGRP